MGWRVCPECGIDRETANAARWDEGLPRLKHCANTCGKAACRRARERRQLREKYGPGTEYYEKKQRKAARVRAAARRTRRR